MRSTISKIAPVCILGLCPIFSNPASGQEASDNSNSLEAAFEPMKWRCIGPFRGGRVTAVAGVIQDPLTFFMGATGGGVWKTDDAGMSWRNVSDGFFKTASVGAIAVAPSDPMVVYVGMGEAPIRGVATTHGDGVYRSTDGGVTWTHLGLAETRHISAICIHPSNPDLVYVAAQGNPYGPSEARGVYRSSDGGDTWKLVLAVDTKTGASSLAIDPNNPRVLYGAMWEHLRTPWRMESGGEGSGLHKSVDGGMTWTKMEEGLPKLLGKCGIAVSPADGNRVYAIVEAEKGGLYRSDDAGKKWKRVNSKRVLQARSWYYMHVTADPLDADTVFVLNAPMLKSTNGGENFKSVPTPHGDNHALWVHPTDSSRMINGNDGGANVSFNGGKSWSAQSNQPTAQFYRVTTDAREPYWVYGGQQDNSTVAIASRTFGGGIGESDWHSVGGCESAHIAFDPDDPRFIYAGCYQGIISEFDSLTRSTRDIRAYPELGLGATPSELTYRFNWNAPILVSPHDTQTLYHAGNVLLRSRDRGVSWEEISADLTRDEEDKQGPGGGPITNEGAGGENYNTIMSVVESPHEKGVIWVGSDDGLIHLTRDDAKTWSHVTPETLGEVQINTIEVSPHDAATVYVAATGFRTNDFSPKVLRSTDYGKTWATLVNGIPGDVFVRVVREDPARSGLLYAGTESGLFVSFNGGEQWSEFQLNLPEVPITDLTIRNGDLIAATQGRAFWILDDLTPLREYVEGEGVHDSIRLLSIRDTLRVGGGQSRNAGSNPANGAWIYYWVHDEEVPQQAESPEDEDSTEDGVSEPESRIDAEPNADSEEEPEEEHVAVLEIETSGGEILRTIKAKKEEDSPERATLPWKKGLNLFRWDLRMRSVTEVPGLFTYGSRNGPVLGPGEYTVRLTFKGQIQEQRFYILPHPGEKDLDYRDQQRLVAQAWELAEDVHLSLKSGRSMKTQLGALTSKLKGIKEAEELSQEVEGLIKKFDAWQSKAAQPKHETFQDVINFKNGIDAQVLELMNGIGGSPPPLTQSAKRRLDDLKAEWGVLRSELDQWFNQDLPAINAAYRELDIPAIKIQGDGSPDQRP